MKMIDKKITVSIKEFETSCFDGRYVTGDITPEYLEGIEDDRADAAKTQPEEQDGGQLDLNLVS